MLTILSNRPSEIYFSGKAISVLRPTLLYISSEAVIPAKAGIQIENTGFRVKPGMTIKVKGLLTQYIT